MVIHTESKAQGWRALAIFKDKREFLVYVGRSTTQIRAGYREAFIDLLEEDEQSEVESIQLQCWEGAPDRGHWISKSSLTIPGRDKVAGMPRPTLSLLRKPTMLLDDEEDTDMPDLLPLPTRMDAARRKVVSH